MSVLAINAQRLREDIATLSQIGRAENQGIYRMAFTEMDMAARDWLKGRIREAGLVLYQDGAANIHARLNWQDDQASVMTGSHMDTVPGGGHLDGALGVLAGLEVLRSLKEQNIPLQRPIESVAFSDEEGRFGGIFGSRAICGLLSPESIHQARDLEGVSLNEVMAQRGLNAMDALQASRHPDSIHSFVELHIEQGPVLEKRQTQIGIVDAIAGLFKWNISLTGTAGHAGATPMDLRQDAFQGLAEFSTELNRVLEEHGSQRSVATIGRVDLSPGAANVVPSRAEFSLDVRDTDQDVLHALSDAMRRTLSTIARRRQLMFEFEVLSEIPPVKSDQGITNTIQLVTQEMGLSHHFLPSGAAHDTQIMAQLTRAAMIFIPSKGGRSHSPAEWSDWQEIENGCNVLLNTIHRLANIS